MGDINDTAKAPARRILLQKVAKVECLSELKTWAAGYALKGFQTVIQEVRPDVFRAVATGSVPIAQ
jgi:hypothetical protein